MPPLRFNPKSQRDDVPPSAPRPVATQPTPAGLRQFKILQSSRAPAQLTLTLRRG